MLQNNIIAICKKNLDYNKKAGTICPAFEFILLEVITE